MNFTALAMEPPAKVSPQNFSLPYTPMTGFNISESFSAKYGHFLPICESFLP